MDAVVLFAASLHTKEEPPTAVMVVLDPGQYSSAPLIKTVSIVDSVIVADALAVQPFASMVETS